MKQMKYILLSVLLFCKMHANEMPEPYRSIHVLPFDGQGWFGNDAPLKNIIHGLPIKTIVEVGSWLGCSTRFFASELPDDGKVYAVDTWLGSEEEILHQTDPRLPYLYQQFLSNVIHAGLTDKIIPVRMKSLEAAKALHVTADLIYLDGAHDTISVYNDILAWYPHLSQHGLMCGDDWMWESVAIAVRHAALLLNKKVHSCANFWWYE